MKWKCRTCNRIKDRVDFYFRKANGHIIQPCKKCAKAAVARWQLNNPEKRREQKRVEYERHGREYYLKYAIDWRKNHPERTKITNRRWFIRNRERVYQSNRAGRLVRDAIASGRLFRGECCEICGKKDCKIEAAHRKYSEPLNVTWLCISCHRKWDSASPKTREWMCGV